MNLKDLFNFLRFPTLGTVFVTNCKNSRKKQIGALRFLERYNFAARGNICMYLCRSMKKSAKDEIAPHLKVIMQCSSKKNIQKKKLQIDPVRFYFIKNVGFRSNFQGL